MAYRDSHSQSYRISRSDSSLSLPADVELRYLDGDTSRPFALIAPKGILDSKVLPTVLAISGEEQCHVSKFFRAWRAEERRWQVIVPLRQKSGTPYLFDEAGVDIVVELMRRILDDEVAALTPFRVESKKFHLVGCSNGGAAVAAVAARVPLWVASLTMVTGFAPYSLNDYKKLLTILSIRLYVGDMDEMGHHITLKDMEQEILQAGAAVDLVILAGAKHGNIGSHIDMNDFWRGLEEARWMEVVRRS